MGRSWSSLTNGRAIHVVNYLQKFLPNFISIVVTLFCPYPYSWEKEISIDPVSHIQTKSSIFFYLLLIYFSYSLIKYWLSYLVQCWMCSMRWESKCKMERLQSGIGVSFQVYNVDWEVLNCYGNLSLLKYFSCNIVSELMLIIPIILSAIKIIKESFPIIKLEETLKKLI